MTKRYDYAKATSFVNIFRNLTSADLITIVALFVSVIALSISFVIGDRGVIFTSAIVSVLVIIVSDRLTSIFTVRDQRELLEQIDDSLHETAACIYVGSPNDGLEYVASKLARTTTVWNTFVLFGVSEGERVSRYGAESAEKIRTATAEFVQKDGRKWTDIFSKDNKEYMDGIKEKLRPDRAGFYQCRILKADYPIINFIILQYGTHGEHSNEVLFGWSHHNKDRIGHVFSSRDQKIVDTFFRYYELLMEQCDWGSRSKEMPVSSSADAAGTAPTAPAPQ